MNLYDVIDACYTATREPDPRILADMVVQQVTDEHIRELVVVAIRERYRMYRIAVPTASDPTIINTEPRVASSGPTTSRIARAVAAGRPIFANGVWKLHNKLTLDDVRWVAADRRSQSAQLSATADRFDRLAAYMVDRSFTNTSDVSPIDLDDMLFGDVAA